ncbi:hypothetical protein FRUB_01525 [Fimbriiglobus ruber]|uniref:Uncharacterized protein n=1 Tax=Fimbriiglobus ruber TaxID=1908690 RepID=A0A225E051_9BACT|nr:hypothetical protein FRUB_01525 [Fimbriiglobus ruber]
MAVQFDSHPLLPKDLREQILANVRAALAAPLGQLGTVDVQDLAAAPPEWGPLVKKFAKEGWPALDGSRELTGAKTHFLRVLVRGGRYRLEARQHDGSTGLTSPLVRANETAAPEMVGRLAGLVVAPDFGPVGTVEMIEGDPGFVKVTFRGGRLRGLEKFVHAGDVFAVAAVLEQARPTPPGARGTRGRPPVVDETPVRVGRPREYTLLRAEAALSDGACRCRVFTRFENAFPTGRGVIGVRCMKLATIEGAVVVRVVDPSGAPAAAGGLLQVRASDVDFTDRPDPRDELKLRNGVFQSVRPLRNVACVVVGLGTAREERFPVPVLGAGPVTVRFAVNADEAARAAGERECTDFWSRVIAAQEAQRALAKAISRLIGAGKNKDALERATAGLAAAAAADRELAAELDRLKQTPVAKDKRVAELLDDAGEKLRAIRDGRGPIEKTTQDLTAAVARSEDPTRFEKEFRAKELNRQIAQHVERGEILEALDLYDELYDLVKQPEIKDRKARLAEDWQPRNAEHKAARDYITDAWRKLTGLVEIKGGLERLKEAAAVLTKNDDRLGLLNLLASFETTYGKLKDILDTVDPSAEGGQATLKDIEAISKDLRLIEGETHATLKKLEILKGK